MRFDTRVVIIGRGRMGKGLYRFLGGLKWPETLRPSDITLTNHDYLEPVQNADIVLEAIIEDLPAKVKLFESIAKVNSKAIVGTNTSSFLMEELEVPDLAGRFLGIHFSNPAYIMPLVEITRALHTTAAVFNTAWRWAEMIGKTPVEAPSNLRGGIIDFVLFPAFEAALELVDHGVDVESIDTSLKAGAGWPSGPLRTMDHIGLDLVVDILRNTNRNVPNFLFDWVEEGRLGKKSKRGFYVYE